jgi:hypothetical protein
MVEVEKTANQSCFSKNELSFDYCQHYVTVVTLHPDYCRLFIFTEVTGEVKLVMKDEPIKHAQILLTTFVFCSQQFFLWIKTFIK